MDALFDSNSTWSERREARRQWGLLFGAVVVFLVSGYACVTEVRYLMFGKRAQATFLETFVETTRGGRYGSESQTLRVRYRFTDEAMEGVIILDRWGNQVPATAQRTESDRVDDDWTPSGATVEVQYLAGSADSSRLAGNTRAWLCVPFLVATVVLAVLGVRFWRDYQEHERRKAAW